MIFPSLCPRLASIIHWSVAEFLWLRSATIQSSVYHVKYTIGYFWSGNVQPQTLNSRKRTVVCTFLTIYPYAKEKL